MCKRKFVFALGVLAIASIVGAASGDAGDLVSRTTHLTFSRPVGLPGVTLAAGTYIFERAAPSSAIEVVRVSSRDRKLVYYTGFTQIVDRPDRLRDDQLITFGEAAAGAATPITAWYPFASGSGHRFIYR